jgi:hypothetical protein
MDVWLTVADRPFEEGIEALSKVRKKALKA